MFTAIKTVAEPFLNIWMPWNCPKRPVHLIEWHWFGLQRVNTMSALILQYYSVKKRCWQPAAGFHTKKIAKLKTTICVDMTSTGQEPQVHTSGIWEYLVWSDFSSCENKLICQFSWNLTGKSQAVGGPTVNLRVCLWPSRPGILVALSQHTLVWPGH